MGVESERNADGGEDMNRANWPLIVPALSSVYGVDRPYSPGVTATPKVPPRVAVLIASILPLPLGVSWNCSRPPVCVQVPVARMPPGSIVRTPADSLVSSSTSSVCPPMMSCDCGPAIVSLSIWGSISTLIVPVFSKLTS